MESPLRRSARRVTKKLPTDSEDEYIPNKIDVTPPKKKKIPNKILAVKAKRVTRKFSSSDSEYEPEKNYVDVTPPKQKKITNVLSPDSNATSLIDKLKITNEKETKYQRASQILNSGVTQELPGREEEYSKLINFLQENLDNKTSCSLYLSGPPGTGKTACLSKILNHSDLSSKFKKVYINCTSVTSIGSVYKSICDELNINASGKKEKDYLNSIEKFLVTRHKMVLLVLDEVDQLIGKKQSILYSIFEWPAIPDSKLLLIGIANSLDLTDRMLPRLHTKCELKPKLMHFAPYTKQQIVEIFKQRLKQADVIDLFPPAAIQLLAAKVAAVSGDIRRALDIGRRVIEFADTQKKQRGKGKLDFSDLGIFPIDKEETTDEIKPVQITQVVSVLNNVYGTSQNLNDDIEGSFPLQQKILICALLLILKHDKNKDVTIGRLHDVYKKVCTKRNILSVDQSEFCGICELVEARGMVKLAKKKESRQNKIGLQWDETEVNEALQDKQLIASILSDTNCLNK